MSSVSASAAAAGGSYSAGAMVPFTQTFVESSASMTYTTPIALVGQVLNNGMTNFVGYNNGSAVYIVSSGAANAVQTTLANGMTYYVSEGAAPGGYLLLSGGAATGTASSSTGTAAGGASSTGMSSSAGGSSGGSQTSGGSGSGGAAGASTTTSSGVAERMEMGGWIAGMVFGLLAVFGL